MWPFASAEPVGTFVEVLLVYRFHHPAHGLLHHLVFYRWYSYRPACSVVFGDIHPSDRLGLVPLQAQAPGASNPTPIADAVSRAETAECDISIRSKVDEQAVELAQFIDQHFRNNKDTSILLPTAIERFRFHTKAMYNLLDNTFPVNAERSGDAISRRAACEKIIVDALSIQKEIVRAHVIQNAHAKQTTKLLDSMKETNAKLDGLNFDIAQLYGYMEVFSTKLPCYAKQCN